MRQLLGLFIAWLCLSAPVQAEIAYRPLEYKVGNAVHEGILVQDAALPGKRPGVLLAHELGANSTAARVRGLQYAKMGYVVLSIDCYGKGVTPKDSKDAVAKAGLTEKDRRLIRARVAAALTTISKLPGVDDKQIAGIGYGIGGTALLELVRAGGDVEGVVCLHGDLSCHSPEEAKKISASVLVIVGADDPQIPAQQVAAFEGEMRGGGVDWQMLRLGGVYHDFTNPQAGKNAKSGSAYDSDADKRAHDVVRSFLIECFPPKQATLKKEIASPKGIPEKVLKVLAFVDERGEAMPGYEGGRTFGNYEKVLPLTDDKGRRVKYREWDVNPLKMGVNRGAERLVTGSEGSAFFTADHYKTFQRIR